MNNNKKDLFDHKALIEKNLKEDDTFKLNQDKEKIKTEYNAAANFFIKHINNLKSKIETAKELRNTSPEKTYLKTIKK